MKIKKSELKQIIKEVLLNEEFADMAEFKVGCERAGNGYHNVQMMIHGKVIASVKVKDNVNKLYEKLFDYCKNAINKTKPAI
jgi:hypothetical protein